MSCPNPTTDSRQLRPLPQRVNELAARFRLKAEHINRKFRDIAPTQTAHVVAALETCAEELEDLLR
jgi:hypothetical protein